MRTIFLSAGHSDGSNPSVKDKGAASNGFIEGLLTIELRNLITKELINFGVTPITDSNSNALSQTLTYFKNKTKPDSLVIDIHFNSASPIATGTETLIPAKYTAFEYNLAADTSKVISDILGLKLRGTNGVKTELESHHGSLGWMKLTGENILLEVTFISNPKDMQIYQDKKHILAKNLAALFKQYAEK